MRPPSNHSALGNRTRAPWAPRKGQGCVVSENPQLQPLGKAGAPVLTILAVLCSGMAVVSERGSRPVSPS